MANVIHRTTLEYLPSANTPDYPEPTWKHSPDMSAVAGLPRKYWKAPADWSPPGAGPVAMNAAEQAAVDAAEQTAVDDAEMAEVRRYVYALQRSLRIRLNNIHAQLDFVSANYRTNAGVQPPTPLGQITPGGMTANIRTQLEGL